MNKKQKTKSKSKNNGKHPGGRPSKTVNDLPENWKETLLEMAMQGASDCEIRRTLVSENNKFSHNLWYALEKREEEFKETLKKARVIRQGWWEEQGRTNLKSDSFNHVLWYMNMKNRFPDDLKDVSKNMNLNGDRDDPKFCEEFFGHKRGTGAAKK